MKRTAPLSSLHRVVAVLSFAILATGSAHATTWYWDPLLATNTATDGTGTWSASNVNWSNGTTTSTYNGVSTDTVVLGTPGDTSTSYTVTVTGTFNAGALTFADGNSSSSGAYNLNGTAGATIVGPSGGTFYLLATDNEFFIHNAINNIAFTGASTYQIDTNTTSLNGGGFNIGGSTTFAGILSLETGPTPEKFR